MLEESGRIKRQSWTFLVIFLRMKSVEQYIIKNFMDGPVDILLFQNHQDYNHPLSGMDRGNERPEPRNTDTSNTSTFPIFPLKLSI